VHRFTIETDEERERIAALFEADPLGVDDDQTVWARAAGTSAAADAKFDVLDARIFSGRWPN